MNNLSINALALQGIYQGVKSAPAVYQNLVNQSLKRTAKTAGINGTGGLAYIVEMSRVFNSKEGKSTSYAAIGVKAALDVLQTIGAEAGKAIHEGKAPALDASAFYDAVIGAHNEAIAQAKEAKTAKKEAKAKEQANNDKLTEEAQASEEGKQSDGVEVTHAVLVKDDEFVIINDEPVLFSELKALYNASLIKGAIDKVSNMQAPAKDLEEAFI